MSTAGKRSQKEKDKAQSRQPTVEQESLPPEQQDEQNQQEITTVHSAVGPSLVPGFSNEQVHAFEAYLGGMIDARLERFLDAFPSNVSGKILFLL